jgi:predicted DNA-binding ribbon-helix-helix protein
MRSQIVKRSFVIAGQKKSISLEEAVWRALARLMDLKARSASLAA